MPLIFFGSFSTFHQNFTDNLVSSLWIEPVGSRGMQVSSKNVPIKSFLSRLAYTQVATLSVYSYLFAAMFAHQFLQPPEENLDKDVFPTLNITFSTTDPFKYHSPDIYVPVFTILEFIGYMGWIKVAETLLNPWGDDDEDFQINYLIDRNFQVNNFELKAIWSSK